MALQSRGMDPIAPRWVFRYPHLAVEDQIGAAGDLILAVADGEAGELATTAELAGRCHSWIRCSFVRSQQSAAPSAIYALQIHRSSQQFVNSRRDFAQVDVFDDEGLVP